jgi:hypothetical protein
MVGRSGRYHWPVRLPKEDWEWVKGNSMDRASIVAAARGTDAVVRAVVPRQNCIRLLKSVR